MAGLSDIEWTDATWNPVIGCSMVSPGCTNCYAMRMAARLEAMGVEAYAGTTRKSGNRSIWTGKVTINNTSLSAPLKWRKPKRIFVNSMSDLFQDTLDIEHIKSIWKIMEEANWHNFQILTKRPKLMKMIIEKYNFPKLPNVWLGTSVESKEYTHRIDEIRSIDAAVRFISFEPLLGEIIDSNLSDIDWVIVGGESGPEARPMKMEWVQSLMDSAVKHKTAFFFKQWGGARKSKTGRTFKGRTWDQFPAQQTQYQLLTL
jgi:protein gp37